jgi:hypothetical protein
LLEEPAACDCKGRKSCLIRGPPTQGDEENSMQTVGQEIGKIETRLRQLGAEFDKLVATADAAGTEAKPGYREQIDDVKGKRAVVHSKLQAYRDARGEKWDNFKGGVAVAWHDFADAFQALRQ